jgi:hypothetical protein
MARLSKTEKKRLRALAKKRHGVAVYAHYSKGKIAFRYLGNWSRRKKQK